MSQSGIYEETEADMLRAEELLSPFHITAVLYTIGRYYVVVRLG